DADQGGAILLDNVGLVFARNCTFADNQAPVGAGLSVVSSTVSPMLLENCLIAFGAGGEGLHWDGAGLLELKCCDIHGNAGGDWIGPLAGQFGLAGNFQADPLFCGALNPEHPYTLGCGSPCSVAYAPVRGLVGALPVGCVLTSVNAPPRIACLYPCVPNPFNPSTTIAFELAEAARVRLAVFDISGRRVWTLADGRLMPAGGYTRTWHGIDDAGQPVAAGVYVCRLIAGDAVDTVRMALVK
ncbi:hypothetical protein KKG45_11775, partial [bacterium]|nr:hypothetical protein [bacterium]